MLLRLFVNLAQEISRNQSWLFKARIFHVTILAQHKGFFSMLSDFELFEVFKFQFAYKFKILFLNGVLARVLDISTHLTHAFKS